MNNENNRFSANKSDNHASSKHFYDKNKLFSKQFCASQENCIITDTGKVGYITAFNHNKVTMIRFQYVSLSSTPCNSQEVGPPGGSRLITCLGD